MIIKQSIFLAILSLIITTSSYSLLGDWNLSTQHLDYAKDLSATNVIFTFNQIINADNKIVGQLTVKTCRLMFYTFSYRQNSIVPIFVRFGQNIRDCVGQEVNQIRRKLQSVFYFSIVDNRLILIYPSQQISFVLVRDATLPVGIKGKWDAVQINGKPIERDTIDVGQNRIALCDGLFTLEYSVKEGNKIDVKQPENGGNKQCQKGDIINALKSSKFYARNESQLRLYSGDVAITLKGQKAKQPTNFTQFQKSKLHDKWYIHSIEGQKLNEQSQKLYYYYFLIINPQKIIFYGGCQVEFAYYDFMNGKEVNLRNIVRNKKTQCRQINSDDSIFNRLFQNAKYVQYHEDTELLTFYDKDSNNLYDFTRVMPKTMDIFPAGNI